MNFRKICGITEKENDFCYLPGFCQVFCYFQPKDMYNLCLNFNESQPVYAYKRYDYKKRTYLHSLQTQTILVVNYFGLLCR